MAVKPGFSDRAQEVYLPPSRKAILSEKCVWTIPTKKLATDFTENTDSKELVACGCQLDALGLWPLAVGKANLKSLFTANDAEDAKFRQADIGANAITENQQLTSTCKKRFPQDVAKTSKPALEK